MFSESFAERLANGESSAIEELHRQYTTLLRSVAARRGMRPDIVPHTVTELLNDIALRCIETHQVPHDIRAYAVAAISNRARRLWRDESRHVEIAAADIESVSEPWQSRRSDFPARSPLSQFLSALTDDLSREDWVLLQARAESPEAMSAVAESLGVKLRSADVRVCR